VSLAAVLQSGVAAARRSQRRAFPGSGLARDARQRSRSHGSLAAAGHLPCHGWSGGDESAAAGPRLHQRTADHAAETGTPDRHGDPHSSEHEPGGGRAGLDEVADPVGAISGQAPRAVGRPRLLGAWSADASHGPEARRSKTEDFGEQANAKGEDATGRSEPSSPVDAARAVCGVDELAGVLGAIDRGVFARGVRRWS